MLEIVLAACVVSIHAPRTEGDSMIEKYSKTIKGFNPRPPHGGRLISCIACNYFNLFQSTPPARRATETGFKLCGIVIVSIHAPRTEGDYNVPCPHCGTLQFQSTPPARRATSYSTSSDKLTPGFNPRPPHGGRPHTDWNHLTVFQFQSTPPARRATSLFFSLSSLIEVSIHAPRTEGDHKNIINSNHLYFK